MSLALERAGAAPRSVDLVSASASSSREADFVEGAAIGGLLGREVPVTAVKSMLGECMGASGALQTAAALVALESGTIPPTINTTDVDPEIRPSRSSHGLLRGAVRTVLVPSLDLQANSACLVVRSE